MGGRSGKAFAGGEGTVQRGQAAARVQKIGLLCDLTKQGTALLAVLAIFSHGLFISPGHFTLITGFASRAHFN